MFTKLVEDVRDLVQDLERLTQSIDSTSARQHIVSDTLRFLTNHDLELNEAAGDEEVADEISDAASLIIDNRSTQRSIATTGTQDASLAESTGGVSARSSQLPHALVGANPLLLSAAFLGQWEGAGCHTAVRANGAGRSSRLGRIQGGDVHYYER